MKKIIYIFINDIKRILKRPAAAVILMGLLVIPGIYAWLNIDSNWNPYDNTGKLPIAIVNKDKGTTILNEDINMGDLVVEGLKENKDMSWVFTNENDAKIELEKSHYYGEIVIPENFSTKLITVFETKKIERPEFDFYVNHKKNPIAPIIVNKAVGAIQNTINQKIVNAFVYKTLNTAGDYGLVTKVAQTSDDLIAKLNSTRSSIDDLRAVFKTVVLTSELTCNTLNAFKELLPTFDDIGASSQNTITDTQSALRSFKNLSDDIDNTITSIENDTKEVASIIDSFDENPQKENAEIISGKVDDASAKLDEMSTKVQKVKGTLSKVSQNINLSRLDVFQGKLDKLSDDINDAQTIIDNNRKTKNNLKDIRDQLKAIQLEEVDIYSTYRHTIKNDMDKAYTNANQSMNSVNGLITDLNKAAGKSDKALDSMLKALGNTKDLTDNIDVILQSIQKDIDKMIQSLQGEKESELYNKFVNLMENDPVEVANFLSTPVKTREIDLYKINTYGSKMAPFYTVLASWVGCTLLISIVKTDIDETVVEMEIKKDMEKAAIRRSYRKSQKLKNIAIMKNDGDETFVEMDSAKQDMDRLSIKTDRLSLNTIIRPDLEASSSNAVKTDPVVERAASIKSEKSRTTANAKSIKDDISVTTENSFHMVTDSTNLLDKSTTPSENSKNIPVLQINGNETSLDMGTDKSGPTTVTIKKPIKLRNYQKFLGRFMLFGMMAMTQGFIIGLGDILLKVQVINVPLFLLTIMTSSFVFMLFIFSVTISFGKVGEAFTIVVMVLQVAGSGGTFPIELLPRVFAVLQPIMPFYPAMNALRETMGGFYQNYYLYYMTMLLCHTIVPLLLGLLFRNPIIHLKQKLDREVEKTNIII